jgi:hypothetical protein
MAFIKLQFKPGVNRDQTDYSNEGGWWECDKIRFRSGYPQKLGGWVKATTTSFLGVCRQMWNWITTFSDDFLAMGTNEKLYIEVAGAFSDITPLRLVAPTYTSTNTNNSVYTTTGSNIVTLTLGVDPGASVGNYVDISGATAVGGVPASELNITHLIQTVGAPANSLTFFTTTNATSTVTGGGGTGITVSFEIDTGNVITVAGSGWGAGAWGRLGWGSGDPSSLINLPQRDWWLDNFDNDLVANIRNGAPYYWERGAADDPATALATRAITLQAYATSQGYTAASVPTQVMQLLVSQQDKHLIACGADFGSATTPVFDPLLIRWSDQDNPGQWTPGVDNSSGFLRVSRGSRIVRALPTRTEILVWTDTTLYTLQFLGTTDVFGLQEYGDNISIASPRAMATVTDTTYWMGNDKFYAYTGRIETLPCTLRTHVFQNINHTQTDQIVSGTNEEWNEVWWFYPTANSKYNDAYVVYNHLEQIWYYGSIERTAWLDSPLRLYPQAANTIIGTGGNITPNALSVSGYLYNHELGTEDDTIPMVSYIQSNDFDIGDGDNFMLTRRIIPDVGFGGSSYTTNPEATLEIRPRNFPGQEFSASSNDEGRVISTSVNAYTDQIFVRARARQMAFKIKSDTAGVQWQLGAPRLDARQDGRK